MNEYILFDMDGTLLELDESGFEAEYMHRAKVFFEQQSPERGIKWNCCESSKMLRKQQFHFCCKVN